MQAVGLGEGEVCMFGVPFPLERPPSFAVWMGNAVGCRLIGKVVKNTAFIWKLISKS